MTPCTRQVMNRFPGDLVPSRAGCWGPLHSCSVSKWAEQYTYQHRETDNQQGRSLGPRLQSHPSKATPVSVWHWLAIWNHLHSDNFCGFQWCGVDAVTPEFPLDLQTQVESTFATVQEYYLKCYCCYCCWCRSCWLELRTMTSPTSGRSVVFSTSCVHCGLRSTRTHTSNLSIELRQDNFIVFQHATPTTFLHSFQNCFKSM